MERANNIGTVALCADFEIKFSMYIHSRVPTAANLLRASVATGANCCNEGDRIPMLYFTRGTSNLNLEMIAGGSYISLTLYGLRVRSWLTVSVELLDNYLSLTTTDSFDGSNETIGERLFYAPDPCTLVQVFMSDFYFGSSDVDLANVVITSPVAAANPCKFIYCLCLLCNPLYCFCVFSDPVPL